MAEEQIVVKFQVRGAWYAKAVLWLAGVLMGLHVPGAWRIVGLAGVFLRVEAGPSPRWEWVRFAPLRWNESPDEEANDVD